MKRSKLTLSKAKPSENSANEPLSTVCAVYESNDLSNVVGIAFVKLETCEAILSQVHDTQDYARTLQTIFKFAPCEILVPQSSCVLTSKLVSTMEKTGEDICAFTIIPFPRRHWSEKDALANVQSLAFPHEVQDINLSIGSNHLASRCFAAVIRYLEESLNQQFPRYCLRIRYQPPEGAMMIDLPTMFSLELTQNLHDRKTNGSLLGVLDKTQTPMGQRLLKSNIIQPLVSRDSIGSRYDAVEELSVNGAMFQDIRKVLRGLPDTDKVLTAMIAMPRSQGLVQIEKTMNNIIMLRQFLQTVLSIEETLRNAQTSLLINVRQCCGRGDIQVLRLLLDEVINEDVKYSRQPLDLRYQRTFAIKAGVNGLLDVSRKSFCESSDDVFHYKTGLEASLKLKIQLKYDSIRQFYLRFNSKDLQDRRTPGELINIVKKKQAIECSTLDLLKLNQRIIESHNECLLQSDIIIQEILRYIRSFASRLFKASEALALLDVLSCFAQCAISPRPTFGPTLSIKANRHSMKEEYDNREFIPNNVESTDGSRFQIITGCNMSGKSTYIQSIALSVVMAQIGSFIPAESASIPVYMHLLASATLCENAQSNVSTFAAEMKHMAYIIRNAKCGSLVLVDEIGRGTSTRDGLAIAISIAETLRRSMSSVWFATHFLELAKTMQARQGVTNLHLVSEVQGFESISMLYKIVPGVCSESRHALALAHVIPLPRIVLDVAVQVADDLMAKLKRQQHLSGQSKDLRRQVLVALEIHLRKAFGSLQDNFTLKQWLEELQSEVYHKLEQLHFKDIPLIFGSLPSSDALQSRMNEHESLEWINNSSEILETPCQSQIWGLDPRLCRRAG